ncbi:MAG: prefoldin subunit alpha [Euryarchaeota archaeon]|nr:prefoldin subunit alpha [Euryarchaeota archaeon]|tara:strand:+ start:15393 stop:15890 length:498 start_codon:yes stop_codon:yes gene_type:complete
MGKEELQQLSQMRELYHQKISQIEEQITKLDQVIHEHETTFRSLKQLEISKENKGMVPIGAGVQIPVDYTNVEYAIIDIGSGFHAEKSLEESSKLLEIRIGELKELIEQLVEEHGITQKAILEINNKLESQIKTIENPELKPDKSKSERSRKRRRPRRGELTLDD